MGKPYLGSRKEEQEGSVKKVRMEKSLFIMELSLARRAVGRGFSL